MRGGQLDRRITILAPGPDVDGGEYGPQPGEYAPIFRGERIPARRVDDLPSNSESIAEGLRLAHRPAKLHIRYRPDITSDMRIIMHDESDKVYEISGGPAEIGRREWIELTIREYSTSGDS